MPIHLGRLFANTKELYRILLRAGESGLKNVVNWVHVMEDVTAVRYIRGSELILTTGMDATAPDKELWLLELVEQLYHHHACGLVVSTGYYVPEIPKRVALRCDELGFPLFTIPQSVHLVDIARDYCNRIFEAEQNEESLTKAFEQAIFDPAARESYQPFLTARGYRSEFTYCVLTLREEEGLFAEKDQSERFDAVMRNRLNRLGARYHLFRHQDLFVVVLAGVHGRLESQARAEVLAEAFEEKYPGCDLCIGVGSVVEELEQLHLTYERALLALRYSRLEKRTIVQFENMGIFRLILSTKDTDLLREMLNEALGPLIRYDQKNHTDHMRILRLYIENNFSVQQVSAKAFLHRNTVNYRIRRIKEILNTDLESMEERLRFLLAFYIHDIM